MRGLFRITKDNLVSRVTMWCIGVLVFLLPLFFIPWNAISIELGKMMLFVSLVVLGVVLVLASSIKEKRITFLRSHLLWMLVVVPAVALVGAVVSPYTSAVFLGSGIEVTTAGFVLMLFATIGLTIMTVDTKGKALNLYLLFFGAILLLGLFHIVRLVFGADVLSFGVFNRATVSLVGGWFDMAGIFGIGVLLGLFALEELNVAPVFKIVLYVVLALSLSFLIIVNVKVLWWALFGVVLAYGLYRAGQTGMVSKRLSWRSGIILLVAFSGLFFSGYIGDRVADKLDLAYVEVAPSTEVMYTIGQDVIGKNAWFGSGPNTFSYVWEKYRPLEINRTSFWNTNFSIGSGFIPTLFATGGLLTISVWMLFFAVIVYFGVLGLRAHTEDDFVRYVFVSSFFTTVYVWFFATLYAPGVAFLAFGAICTGVFFASLGFMEVLSQKRIAFNESVVIPVVLPAALLVVLLFGYGYGARFVSAWHFNRGVALVGTSELDAGLERIERAVSWYASDRYYRAEAQVHALRLSDALGRDDVTQGEVEGILAQAVGAAQRATKIDMYDIENWTTLADVYASAIPLRVSGAGDAAFTALFEAAKISPKHPRISIAFADVAIKAGDYETAHEYLEKARAQKPNLPTVFTRKADIALISEGRTEALEILEEGSSIIPDSPVLPFRSGLIYYEMRAFKSALSEFEKAIAINEQYLNAQFYRAASLYMLGEDARAIEELESLIAQYPDDQILVDARDAMRDGVFGGSGQSKIETEVTPEMLE